MPSSAESVRPARRCLAALLLLACAGAVATGASATRAPTATQIESRLTAAAHASRARVVRLDVDLRRRTLRLDVSVDDPAAYLKDRYARVVAVVYPGLVGRFAAIYLKVVDGRSGYAVLRYSDTPGFGPGATRQQAWRISPRLVDCARNLPLDDIEIDPDHAAPPCPAK